MLYGLKKSLIDTEFHLSSKWGEYIDPVELYDPVL